MTYQPAATAVGPEPTWPLVGRSKEVRAAVGALRRGSVVLVAATGCGRSRVLSEIVSSAARRHPRTLSVAATAAASTTPFGSLGPLLGRLGAAPGVREVQRVVERVSPAAGPPMLLAVDDAHLLDPASAALLLQLATAGAARVAATVRRDAAAPDAVTALWKEGHAERIDLPPFDHVETAQALERALGGPIARASVERFHRLSDGYPLILRELVIAGHIDGNLARRDGMWFLAGDPQPTARLLDLVRHRWPATDRLRLAAELIALSGPLPIAVVESLIGASALVELERFGMVTSDQSGQDGADGAGRLTRVIDGHVLRAGTGLLTRHQHLRTLLSALPHCCDDPDLDARIVEWRIDLRRPVESPRLTAAARRAGDTGRHTDAEALARTAVAQGGGDDAVAVLAAALLRRDPEAATTLIDDTLATGATASTGDAERRLRALRRAASGRRTAPTHRDGRTDPRELVEAADRYDDADWDGLAAWWHDRLTTGDDLAGTRRTAARHRTRPPGVVRDLAELALGWSAQLAGDLHQADLTLTELGDRLDRVDPGRLASACRAVLTQVRAQMGDLVGAMRTARRFDTDQPGTHTAQGTAWLIGSAAVEVPLARVWLLAARGSITQAVETALAAAEAVDDRRGREALIRAALRLGCRSTSLAALPVGNGGGALAQLTVAHAAAVRDDDVRGLSDVSAAYETGGFALLAAEAWTSVQRRCADLGDSDGSRHAAAMAQAAAHRCTGAATPMLTAAAHPLLHLLTTREEETVRLAAAGHSNAEIAAELRLSVRTIESHLYRAMTKLGVHRRQLLLDAPALRLRGPHTTREEHRTSAAG
ncbi:helix-turn-helix transcriptional regulator [Pseudonocardia sp. TRM90224]|uniref:helix-turn-helix transcriptional regulator n=1 Tax=Pseudonocardia sp. TRM90224 TaxID=2812678 RepID=UPI001E6315B0|nr:helix-turn-helix transcriptional regulator [Pseudonocardia sp. TRM90224]